MKLFSGFLFLSLLASCSQVEVDDGNFPPMGDAVAEEEESIDISTLKSLANIKDNKRDPFFEEHFGEDGTFETDTIREREAMRKRFNSRKKKDLLAKNGNDLQCKPNSRVAYRNRKRSLPCKEYLTNYQMSCYGKMSSKGCKVLLKVTNNCFAVSQCAKKGLIDLSMGQAYAFNITGRAATFEEKGQFIGDSPEETLSPCFRLAMKGDSLSARQNKFYNKFCKCACGEQGRTPAGYFTIVD